VVLSPRLGTRKSSRKRRAIYKTAKQAVIKAGQYAYRDRRQRKRQFRALWIVRINAAARLHGMSYSRLIIDRKVLADLAVHDLEAFGAIAAQAKSALADTDTASAA